MSSPQTQLTNPHHNSALPRHYWTQPSPNPLSRYFAALPTLFHQFSCAAVLFIELVVPFFVLFPPGWPWLERFACACYVLLQILINSAGNFAYLSFMCTVTSLAILNEKDVIALFGDLFSDGYQSASVPSSSIETLIWSVWGVLVVLFYFTFGFIALSQHVFLDKLATSTQALSWLPELEEFYLLYVIPWRVVNTYRKFAVTSASRWEFVIEGSMDKNTWLPYEFRWKVGNPQKSLCFIPLYLPRLDWRVWQFASGLRHKTEKTLGDPEQTPFKTRQFINFGVPVWFKRLLLSMLTANADVINSVHFLEIPFQNEPPAFVRCRLFVCTFGKNAEWDCTDLNLSLISDCMDVPQVKRIPRDK